MNRKHKFVDTVFDTFVTLNSQAKPAWKHDFQCEFDPWKPNFKGEWTSGNGVIETPGHPRLVQTKWMTLVQILRWTQKIKRTYNSNYPDNTNCNWFFGEEGSEVEITFTAFAVENHATCNYDAGFVYF